MLPSWEVYGNHSSNNAVRFFNPNGSCFWFSYKTLVASSKPGAGKFVIENYWGPTTGKHLNAIDDGNRKARLTREQFEAKFREIFGREEEVAA